MANLEESDDAEEDILCEGDGDGDGEPKRRRVEENKRDGKRRVDENWTNTSVILS